MPVAAPHPCATPGCPILVQRGQASCAAHERTHERQRGSAAARGYDRRWRKYRLWFLREHPLCVLCLVEGRTEPATVVDHIHAHKGDHGLMWDTSNHRAVCRTHHDQRTDEGDFGR